MKRLLISMFVAIASVGAYAQPEAGRLTIQPKVGLNVSSFISSYKYNPRVGVAGGFEVEYDFTKHIGLSVGALYSMQGAKSKTTASGCYDEIMPTTTVKMTSKIDYINIPIMANIYVYKGLALKLGVQPGFNVLAKYTESVDVEGGLSETNDDYLSAIGVDVRPFDFDIPIGISYEIKNVVIDARYNLGVLKMIDHKDPRNSVFQFTLGYKFGLK